MIPIQIYLATSPTDLLAGYKDFVLATNVHIGYGSDSSLWTTDQVDELDRRVDESYRNILYPSTIPGERIPHIWSFAEQFETLTTVADDFDYALPANFGSIVGDLTFTEGKGYGPIKQTSAQAILRQRQVSSRTGVPEYFATRWLVQTSGLLQRQEILFYPVPDDVYVLTYSYAVLAPKLSKLNPYPLGGPRMSQLMIEACKAVGEQVKDGQRGDQWGVFREALLSAIQMDKGTNFAPTVGFLKGADRTVSRRPLIGSVSYFFGPDADGGYTLET